MGNTKSSEPVRTILTEEELKEWFEEPRHLPNTVSDYRIKRLIGAYRSLLSANAELSFKNQKLIKENNALIDSIIGWTREEDETEELK